MFLWHILLALTWAALTGVFTWNNVLVGFILAYPVLFIAQRCGGLVQLLPQDRSRLALRSFDLWELILANLRVAY